MLQAMKIPTSLLMCASQLEAHYFSSLPVTLLWHWLVPVWLRNFSSLFLSLWQPILLGSYAQLHSALSGLCPRRCSLEGPVAEPNRQSEGLGVRLSHFGGVL